MVLNRYQQGFPLFKSLLQANSLSNKNGKLPTMVKLSSQWYARLLWSNFGHIKIHNFFLFLALHALLFIKILKTHSFFWLINEVVCLINEMRATILLPLRIIGAQGSNVQHIMSRGGVFCKKIHVLRF